MSLFWNASKQARLSAIGALLGGGRDESSAWGCALGAPSTLRFVIHGSGKRAERWTELEVELPVGYPFALHICPQGWTERTSIAHGERVKLTTGDRLFDQSFVVEAAPADIVRPLLDARIRSQLYVLPSFELSTTTTAAPMLHLEISCWVDVDEARALISALVSIANGLPEAYARVEAADAPRVIGAPFREQLDDSAAREAAAARDAEVALVHKVQRQRSAETDAGSSDRGLALFLGILAGIGYLLFTLAR